MRPKAILTAILCITITGVVQAQPITAALDSFYTRIARAGQLNGNVLIAENGKIIYQRSFGYADQGQRLNDADTEFNLASVSKTFTATAILQLYEKKKLKLDDTYAHYFPGFPYTTVTIRQMLSHSSGLSDQDLGGIWDNVPNAASLTNQDAVGVIAAAKVKLKLAPNEKWWYSNTGYSLLAALVEKLSGEPFHQYLDRHIFKPAGMQHTYLKTKDINKINSPALSLNYDYDRMYSGARTKLEGARGYYTDNRSGASDIISTTGDMLRFDNALRSGRLLKETTLNAAQNYTRLRDGKPNFVWKNIGGMGNAYDGLGWFVFGDSTTGKTVWHAGGMPGCATMLLRNISRNQVVIVLDNHSSEGLYRTTLAGMRILNNQPYAYPKRSLARQYGRNLMAHGADHAYTDLRQCLTDTAHYNVHENDMNNLGYAFLEDNLTTQALEVFKLNTLLYPQSDNAFNSYAEALEKAGRIQDAVSMFRYSLVINPDNEDSKRSLLKLEKP